MNVEAGIQVSDLRGLVRRRAMVVLGTALAVSLAAYWLGMALPNEYESHATVLVQPQEVDPDLVESGVGRTDINRRLHLMAAQILSRPRLSRIIDELDLFADESKYLVRDVVVSMMRDQVRVEPVIPEMERDQARGDKVIDQFRISFTDHDPVVARDVAQRLANDFIEEHIASRVRVSQKSVEFIDAELTRLADAIREVEARVADVKAANAGKLPEDMPANQRALERLSGQVALARREMGAARSDEAFFRSQSATAQEFLGGGMVERAESPASRMRILELVLAEFEARGFTEKHPDVIKTKAEIETLRAQMARAQKDDERPGSFAQHSAEAEAQRARLRQTQAEEEIALIEERAAQVQLLLAQTPQVAEVLDGLEREYQHLFTSYQDFSQRRLEAGVQADLERRQLGEQFRVLESAFLAPQPASPNRPLIIAIGVIFGLALGVGLGIVLEAADASVHDARGLQSSLQIPVLAAIPTIWLESDRLAQRRSRILKTFATVAVVGFVLVGGAANYWWVNGGAAVPEEFAPAPGVAAGADDAEEPEAPGDTTPPGGE
jgi:polysaccharide chain length determinant protein (PEP-CTERM system associated)